MGMQTIIDRSRRYATVLVALFLTALLLLTGCAGRSAEPDSAVELAPFKEMARDGGCADVRNRLFVIDDQLVFWERVGNCADAAYGQALYGSTPDQVLCVSHDSIAGPVKNCQDARYQEMFDTMTANLDKLDLGLGPGHTVQSVSF
jgi:hypothetical protein